MKSQTAEAPDHFCQAINLTEGALQHMRLSRLSLGSIGNNNTILYHIIKQPSVTNNR